MADDLDILTGGEARALLRHDDLADNDLIGAYVTAASRLLDQRVGPVVRRTVTAEAHDGGYFSVELGGPVESITSITVDGVAVAAADYFAERYDPDRSLLSGWVYYRPGDAACRWPCGHGNVVATYVAGRYADTETVDARFKRACGIVVKNLWRDQQSTVAPVGEYELPIASFPTYAMPRAAEQLLARELRVDHAFGIAVMADPQGSAHVLVGQALIARLQARDRLSGVAVSYDPPRQAYDVRGQSGNHEAIWLGPASGTYSDVVLCGGGLRFDEDVELTVTVQVLRPTSSGTQEKASTRAAEIVYEVLAAVAEDATLGITSFDYVIVTAGTQDWSRSGQMPDQVGHVGACDLGLNVRSRRSYTL